MKSTHRAAVAIEGQTLLGDLRIEALRRELLPTPDPREEASLVFSGVEVDQPCPVELRRGENHFGRPFPVCSSSGHQKKSASICRVEIKCFNCSNRVNPRNKN